MALSVDPRDPYVDEGMVGFINSFARKNLWRVGSFYDLDDLVQDGWMCFYKCRARYVGVDRPLPAASPTRDHLKWMMSLVMTTFARHIHTLSSKRTALPEEPISQMCVDGESVDDAWARVTPVHDDSSVISVLAGMAGTELGDLVSTLVRDARDAYAGFRLVRRGKGVVRETGEERRVRLSAGGEAEAPRRSRLRVDDAGRVVRRRRAIRETTNQFYCRVLGLDPAERDVRGEINDYLS